MTLRRYAPLALAVLALACKPDIEQGANRTTSQFAVFDPATNRIPTPNTIALAQFEAGDPGPAALPCSFFLPGDPTKAGLCAFARAGAFPTNLPIEIGFETGTLPSDGPATYAPAPLDAGSLLFAGAAATPSIGIFDVTDAPTTIVPKTLADVTATYDDVTGTLEIAPIGGNWEAGHSFVVLVRGGADGIKTTAATGTQEFLAMPTLFILREATLADADLQLPANQSAIPGTPAEKAALGAQLEQIRAGFHEQLLPLTVALQRKGVDLPFDELISIQSFSVVGAGRTIAIGEGTDPANATVTTGNSAALDAFTVQSNVATATLVRVDVNLTNAGNAVAALTISASPTCATATTLGALATGLDGTGTKAIQLSVFPSATLTAATPLWVCATASGNSGTVTGTVTAVTAFTGTGYTSAATGDAASATLTVN